MTDPPGERTNAINTIVKRRIPIFYFPGKPQSILLPDTDADFAFIEIDYIDDLLCFDAFIISRKDQMIEKGYYLLKKFF